MLVQEYDDFNPKLFECIDKALISILGGASTSTFYYAISERFDLARGDFERKPLEVLDHLRTIVGEGGFSILELAIVSQIIETFKIANEDHKKIGISNALEQAEKNHLRSNFIHRS